MVALCLQHHKEADVGAFTNEQLRSMKDEGYLRRTGAAVAGAFNWKRDQLVVRAGGLTAVGCTTLLRFGDTDGIWLAEDAEGNETLNLDLWNTEGGRLFSLRQNDWITVGPLQDLECPPSGRLILRVPSSDVRIAIKFTTLGPHELYAYFRAEGIASAKRASRAREQEATRAEKAGAPALFIEVFVAEPTIRWGSLRCEQPI